MSAATVIETEGLTKLYGNHRGIGDLTLAVEAGEVFGFLGPNGAGKTTTIRTLLDLIHPTRGKARIFGLDSQRDSVAIRARIGNLPGDFGYGRQASGREALRMLARLRGVDGIGRAESLAKRFRAVACAWSLRTSVVTGAVAGVLVAMYVVDLVGKLDSGLEWVRYVSVFKYYGNAIEDGIEPLAFVGVTAVAVLLTALGSLLFDRRDISA